MKILTWNINGIRACKQPFKDELSDLASDIICLQETKITRDLLDEETAIQDGYSSYFSFSKKKSGYSGVATYCKLHATPLNAEEGLSGIQTDVTKGAEGIGHYGDLSEFTDEELLSLESEGRAILTEHQYRNSSGQLKQVVVINVYCPRADPEREGRLDYKIQFYKLLQIRAEALLEANKHVIILGDFNVSHKPIDNCDPECNEEKFYARPSRRWLENLLADTTSTCSKKKSVSLKKNKRFMDSFRYFHPSQENAFTAWSTLTGARQTNYGIRIDYIVADVAFCRDDFIDCEILQDFEGSDHCPVKATLKGTFEPAEKFPNICTKFMPEFLGKQQKLSSFFTKGVLKEKAPTETSETIENEKQELKSLKGKRPLETSKVAPSSKKRKSEKKNQSSKNASIKSFFKKVSSDTELASQENNHDKKKLEIVDQFGSNQQSGLDERPQLERISNVFPLSFDVTSTNNSEKNVENDSQESLGGEKIKTKKQMASSWKIILKGPPPAPLCKGHKVPCLLRTVKKPGPNLGKQFYVCCKPEGHKSNPDARCNHFQWVITKLKNLDENK